MDALRLLLNTFKQQTQAYHPKLKVEEHNLERAKGRSLSALIHPLINTATPLHHPFRKQHPNLLRRALRRINSMNDVPANPNI